MFRAPAKFYSLVGLKKHKLRTKRSTRFNRTPANTPVPNPLYPPPSLLHNNTHKPHSQQQQKGHRARSACRRRRKNLYMIVEPTTKALWRKKCMRARGRYVLRARSTAFATPLDQRRQKLARLIDFSAGRVAPCDRSPPFSSSPRSAFVADLVLPGSSWPGRSVLPCLSCLVLFGSVGGGLEAGWHWDSLVVFLFVCTWFGKFV